jgi:hypothetical protein
LAIDFKTYRSIVSWLANAAQVKSVDLDNFSARSSVCTKACPADSPVHIAENRTFVLAGEASEDLIFFYIAIAIERFFSGRILHTE